MFRHTAILGRIFIIHYYLKPRERSDRRCHGLNVPEVCLYVLWGFHCALQVSGSTADAAPPPPIRAFLPPLENKCSHGNAPRDCKTCDTCPHGKSKVDCNVCVLDTCPHGNARKGICGLCKKGVHLAIVSWELVTLWLQYSIAAVVVWAFSDFTGLKPNSGCQSGPTLVSSPSVSITYNLEYDFVSLKR